MNPALRRASFHDPDGSLYLDGERLLRGLEPGAAARVERFAATPLAAALQAEGAITDLRPVDGPDPALRWFEHRRLPFVAYPHEWTPEQLADAAAATLALARRLREHGWDLKDGNLRNVVFEGPRPVFVDWGSFVPRDDTVPVWRPAGPLQRQALLPLLLLRHRGWPVHQTLLASPDGVDPERAHRALGIARALLDPAVAWHAALPAWLGRRGGSVPSAARRLEPEAARRAVDMTVAGLARAVGRLRRRLAPPQSGWAGYETTRAHYEAAELGAKQAQVGRWLDALAPAAVLDIGANGGEFSLAAARRAGLVVAVDNDVDALRVARRATAAAPAVHHLLVDVAAPTPALGWRGAECLSFDERCAGRFDLVLALAVLHHWTVSGGIPLAEVVAWLARCTRRWAIVEFVDPADPRFVQIAAPRGRDGHGLGRDDFERALAGAGFAVLERVEAVAGRRWLYLAEKG